MRIIYEAASLVKVDILYDGNRGWTLSWGTHKFKVVYGSIEEFSKFLMKIQAKDDKTSPKSARGATYLEIAQEAADGSDTTIWVWDRYLKSF